MHIRVAPRLQKISSRMQGHELNVSQPSFRAGAITAMAAVLSLGVSACESAAQPSTKALAESSAPAASPTSSPSASSPVLSSPSSGPEPALPIPGKDEILVPPMSGTSTASTPEFTVERGKFTVRAVCSGNGTLQVRPGKQSVEVPCDGKPRRVHVVSDNKKTSVKIVPVGAAHWTVAVVVTDDLSTGTETPAALPSRPALMAGGPASA